MSADPVLRPRPGAMSPWLEAKRAKINERDGSGREQGRRDAAAHVRQDASDFTELSPRPSIYAPALDGP
jgi:hypothetical protein